uniref:Nicotinate-nucleotide pyrophosphorylase [carboxylating] n=1 Tax=Pinguiococcus pyrenoidosus TaxID=172671 RepID=A0A7R9U3Q0_9STRA
MASFGRLSFLRALGAPSAIVGAATLGSYWQWQSSCEAKVKLEHVLPPHWKATVESWLRDDMPSFDVGGLVVGDVEKTAHLFGKSNGILAGRPFFDAVFEALGCEVEWLLEEGDVVDASQGKVHVATVKGPSRLLLIGERTALNTLARASGVATKTRAAVTIAQEGGWHGSVAGTRKTTPGFRIVEKYALLVGGGATHRLDLSQMVMLKDNHIWSAGSITDAVKVARSAAGFSAKIEVEARTLEEGVEAAEAGADIVMLDNFEPGALKVAAKELKRLHPSVLIEASGGITTATMGDYFSEHVDIISQGNLTQGYPVVDFSLKIQK